MDKKKILLTIIIGLLSISTIIGFGMLKSTKSKLDEETQANTKLVEQNKKLIDANTKADKKIDDLAKKYDGINKELEKIKSETGTVE
ncbi:hypothetical protein [Vagococcus hydrophili]|uniref:Uncharacterized protein n=1 Tax=Vagococcus hydrophili TaxID=2714947 RepID=A0A6G8AWB7_9ENTE|nr:hypothetical protein [Vagococcus hydrophili]QIL49391.1 hypothetical protein G7082_13225 [Vagococcus hydrophili]